MTVIRVQWTWKAKSGQSRDGVVNTFHFLTPPGAATDAQAMACETLVSQFFTDNDHVGNTVAGWLSGSIAQNGHSVKTYDLGAPTPRVPLRDSTYNLSFAPSSPSLPAEVAVCASFHSAYSSGVSKARHRGRIFLGPLRSTGAIDTDANGFARPSVALKTSLIDAMVALKTNSETAGLPWGTHSTLGTTGAVNVVGGWVDDAFDTQRRRGPAPTSKTTWGV